MRLEMLNMVLLGIFATVIPKSYQEGEQSLRVYGGAEVEVDHIPYIVSILFKHIHFCGGAILSEDWIITAAHCVFDKTHDLEIIAGFVDRQDINDGIQLSTVEEAFIHPLYEHKKHSITHDVALIKLKTKLNFSEEVAPISIVEENELKEVIEHQELGIISGWGANEISILSKSLYSGMVKLESDEDCSKHDTPDCEQFQPAAHLCSSPGTEEDPQPIAGFGDDGSPLVVRNKLAGIVLQGHNAQKGDCDHYATTYARVDYYKSFIEHHIPELFKAQDEDSYTGLFEVEFVFQYQNKTGNEVYGISRNFYISTFSYWWFDERDADEEYLRNPENQTGVDSKKYIINFKLVKTLDFSNECLGLNVFNMFVITPYVSITYME